MIFYFLRAGRYAECKVIITGKEVDLSDGDASGNASALLVKDFWNKKYITNTL